MKDALENSYPTGDPESITCRHCGDVRVLLRRVGDYAHRVCRVCDSPRERRATWDTEASR